MANRVLAITPPDRPRSDELRIAVERHPSPRVAVAEFAFVLLGHVAALRVDELSDLVAIDARGGEVHQMLHLVLDAYPPRSTIGKAEVSRGLTGRIEGIMLRNMVDSVSREEETFGLSLRLFSDGHVGAKVVTETARDLDALLRELEKAIDPEGKSRATWQWSEPDPEVQFIATPNGASADTLQHVVSAAQEGFQGAASAESHVVPDWPSEFTHEARRRAERILRRLSELQSIVVQATGFDALQIQHANVGETVLAQPAPRRLFSSVDGVLRVLTGGDKYVTAGLREHRTNHYVRCTFVAAEWKDRLGPLWEHRVTVEGMVAYDQERRPSSVIDIKRVTPREPGRPMSALAGMVPDLTGGRTDDEFVAAIRGHD